MGSVATKKLTPQQRRELAAEAECDDRTVKRWLEGLPMRPTTKTRLDRAWSQLKKGFAA